MELQYWSWILTAVSLTALYLIGKKVWWSWYILIGLQILWVVYSLITQQYGFLIAAVAYTGVFGKNAFDWTRAHRAARHEVMAQLAAERESKIQVQANHIHAAVEEADNVTRPLFEGERGKHIVTHEEMLAMTAHDLYNFETSLIEQAVDKGLEVQFERNFEHGVIVHWRPDTVR